MKSKLSILISSVLCLLFISCKHDLKREEIRLDESSSDVVESKWQLNSDSLLRLTLTKDVILTGMNDHRLIGIYKAYAVSEKNKLIKVNDEAIDDYDFDIHYMPGLDLFYGYQLINISHYNFESDSSTLFFDKNVLIKNLYFPSFEQDSINKKPINRNYYLVSVFDEDTNKDGLINKNDLKHFYSFNADATSKTQLIPNNYTVVRSEYDSGKDVMYIYAKEDSNKNGRRDSHESLHIFWISLKEPKAGIRII